MCEKVVITIERYGDTQRQGRRSAGRCTHCGVRPPVAGKTECEACRQKGKEEMQRRKATGLCHCGARPPQSGKAICEPCARKEKERLIWVKLDCFAAYGGICQWEGCGNIHPDHLQIDHIYDDAHTERKNGSGTNMYRRLRRLGYPKDRYHLLCSCHNREKQNLKLRGEPRPLFKWESQLNVTNEKENAS